MRLSRRRIAWVVVLLIPVGLCAGWIVYRRFPDPHQRYRVDTVERMTTLAFSPDGTLLATGATSGTITLWRVMTGERVQTLTGHTAAITDLAFRPDGTQLLSVARDETIRRWDVASGVLRPFPDPHLLALSPPSQPPQPAYSYFQLRVAWSEDGVWFAGSSNDGRVFLMDAVTDSVLNVFPIYEPAPSGRLVSDLLLNRAHQLAVTSGGDGEDQPTKFWGLPNGTLLATSDDASMNLYYSMIPDRGRLRLSADRSWVFRINKGGDRFETWDTTGKHLTTVPSNIQINGPPLA